MGGQDGDLLLFVADTWKVTCGALAALRNRIAREQQLYDPASFSCLWVVDFPLLTWNAEEGDLMLSIIRSVSRTRRMLSI
ncbi:MAG UNVERIFIED_CONTAM: hypothetical protein LVR18_49575 [Planctomycetaceae bacterium]|jgi:aspartyl-tRNA synthetase